MVETIQKGIALQSELLHKYKDSKTTVELEIYLLAKANIKLLREQLPKEITFYHYWEETYGPNE